MSQEICPYQSEQCQYFDSRQGCFSDDHHIYFPSSDFKTTVERVFRDLPENHVQLCRYLHDVEHELPKPPKPMRDFMIGRIALAYNQDEITLSESKKRKLGFI